MRTVKKILLTAIPLALASLTLLGCQKDYDITSLRVEIEQMPHYKTFIDNERYTCWSDGDQVRVNNQDFTLHINGSDCRIDNISISSIGYTALSPATLATSQTTMSSAGITNLLLPSTYTYSPDNIPVVMAAYLPTETGTIAFKNACMVMQLNLTNNYSHSIRISNVKISDNLAPLSGAFQIDDIDSYTPTLTRTAGGDTTRTVMLQMTETEPIELDPNESVNLYAVLPPTDSYTGNKFTIEIDALDLQAAENDAIVIYHFKHRQAANANGCIPRNTLVPLNIELDAPHTTTLQGLGTETNPYKISSIENLIAMEQLVNRGYDPIGLGEPFASAHYVQTTDISDWETNVPLHPIGNDRNNFTGVYDGQGHFIDLFHTAIEGEECVGLFGYIANGAIIKSVYLYCNALRASTDYYSYHSAMIGLICGHAENSTIDRCKAVSSECGITCNTVHAYIGGIVGEMTAGNFDRSLLTNCHNFADIYVNGDRISNRYYVGGIAGHIANSTIINSFDNGNRGAQNAAFFFGGIAGRADGSSNIFNCYKAYNPEYEPYGPTNNNAAMRADICASVGSQCHIEHCFYRNILYATGNPTSRNIENNIQYLSYRNATGQTTNGPTTLKDHLQQYVDNHNNNNNVSLSDWEYRYAYEVDETTNDLDLEPVIGDLTDY